MEVRTAVITAAGYGTRFLPISKAIPKEMLPLVDRPVIQYAVEQAVEAGIERIVLVTSVGKKATEDYFGVSADLEKALEARHSPKLDEVRRVSRMADLVPVTQAEPLGLGHAVLCAREAVGDEPFILYLPDEILVGKPSVTHQMLDAFERLGEVVGVVQVPHEDVSRYGVIDGEQKGERDWHLRRCVEKPTIDDAPSDLAIVGPYVFTPAIFDCLASVTSGAIGEIQLTDGIDLLAKQSTVHAHRFDAKRYDAGTPLGLMTTAIELALERQEYAADIKVWLNRLANEV